MARGPFLSGKSCSFSRRNRHLSRRFFLLKIGMKVRHPKFGDGRVRSVEGRDEEQKATILFQSVGSKRLKVSVAHLEILGG